MMMQFNKTWFSPLFTREEVLAYAKTVGFDKIQEDKKYQKINEARQASLIAFVVHKLRGADATFLRLPRTDPPDAILMQLSPKNKGTMDITQLELTDYRGGKPLLDQLKERKIPEGHQIFSEHDVLVIELYTTQGIDYKAIYDYLQKNNVTFDVWTFRQYSLPTTELMAEVIRVPESEKITVNLSQEAYKMEKTGIPDIVTSKRVGSLEKVRFEPTTSKRIPPWESLED